MTPFTLPIPTYQCHKRVQALRIKAVVPNPRGWELHFEDSRFVPMQVEESFLLKHSVAPGSYVVWYEDGYVSVSPAAAFEAGYTLADGGSALPAGDAAELARAWHAFAKEWPGGPSEVEAALASRDAEIRSLSARCVLLSMLARNAFEEWKKSGDVFGAMHRLIDEVNGRDHPPAEEVRPVGPATQAAREVHPMCGNFTKVYGEVLGGKPPTAREVGK